MDIIAKVLPWRMVGDSHYNNFLTLQDLSLRWAIVIPVLWRNSIVQGLKTLKHQWPAQTNIRSLGSYICLFFSLLLEGNTWVCNRCNKIEVGECVAACCISSQRFTSTYEKRVTALKYLPYLLGPMQQKSTISSPTF